jgi:hypothetical protein
VDSDGNPRASGKPASLERVRGDLERHPVALVRRSVSLPGDPESLAVELVARDDCPHRRVGPVRVVAVGAEIRVDVDAFVRQPPERTPPRQDVLPQPPRRGRVRIPAGHADDRDGSLHFDLLTTSIRAGLGAAAASNAPIDVRRNANACAA